MECWLDIVAAIFVMNRLLIESNIYSPAIYDMTEDIFLHNSAVEITL